MNLKFKPNRPAMASAAAAVGFATTLLVLTSAWQPMAQLAFNRDAGPRVTSEAARNGNIINRTEPTTASLGTFVMKINYGKDGQGRDAWIAWQITKIDSTGIEVMRVLNPPSSTIPALVRKISYGNEHTLDVINNNMRTGQFLAPITITATKASEPNVVTVTLTYPEQVAIPAKQ